MTLESIMNALWVAVLVLAALAALQFAYLLWLNLAPVLFNRKPRTPKDPIMPTVPQGGVTSAPPNASALRVDAGKMVVVSGLMGVSEISFPSSRFNIGRFYAPETEVLVALDEKSISRRHATFEGDDALRQYTLTDTDSSYGTFIQREGRWVRLNPRQRERIYHDDLVQFGNQVTVRFVLAGERRPAGR
jgi:hypothetical protein